MPRVRVGPKVVSKSIRIDEDVWEHLRSHGETFVGTPNSTLRRLLRLDKPGAGAAALPCVTCGAPARSRLRTSQGYVPFCLTCHNAGRRPSPDALREAYCT